MFYSNFENTQPNNLQGFQEKPEISRKKGILGKTVQYLRGKKEKSRCLLLFKRAITVLLSLFLLGTVAGIPVLIAGIREWKKQNSQENQSKLKVLASPLLLSPQAKPDLSQQNVTLAKSKPKPDSPKPPMKEAAKEVHDKRIQKGNHNIFAGSKDLVNTYEDLSAYSSHEEFEPNYNIYGRREKKQPVDHKELNKIKKLSNRYNIDVGAYSITYSSKNNHILYTNGVGPCIGLVLFHKKSGKTLFAHCYCQNNTIDDDAQRMIEDFQGANKIPGKEIIAYVFGGNTFKASVNIAKAVINNLQKKNIPLHSKYLFPQKSGYGFTPHSGFNSRTGVLTINYYMRWQDALEQPESLSEKKPSLKGPFQA